MVASDWRCSCRSGSARPRGVVGNLRISGLPLGARIEDCEGLALNLREWRFVGTCWF